MKGYWNREDLNSKSFTAIKGAWYYRTGDYVKMLPNATLSFLGRKDRQIKLRGFRVELDELEHILYRINGVQEIAIFTIGEADSMWIKASIVIDQSVEDIVSEKLIIKKLSSLLPPYAIPSKIEILKELPRTSTGKIDRQKLILETNAI